MPKDRDPSSPADDQQQTRALADEAEDIGAEQAALDARKDPEKRKENRRKLGVDEEHETPEMKEGHRGTFP